MPRNIHLVPRKNKKKKKNNNIKNNIKNNNNDYDNNNSSIKLLEKINNMENVNDNIIQDNSEIYKWNIIGLKNDDGVSCYANSAVQALLHSYSLRKYIESFEKDGYIKKVYNEYIF